MPHLVQMHEKYGSRGFNIVGVTVEDGGTVDSFLKQEQWKQINYYIGVTPRNAIEPYGIRGWPTCYLIGPDGKIVSKTRRFTDEQIAEMVSKLAPAKVGREVAKDVRKAAAAFDKGEFGTATKELEKFLAEDAAEKFDEETRTDAAFVRSLIEKQVEATTRRLNDAVTAREWLEVQKMLPDLKKRFKGMPLEDRIKEVETTMRTREVRAEVTSLTEYEKLAEEWKKAANERAKEGVRVKVEAFIKKHEGTKGAEKAQAMINK